MVMPGPLYHNGPFTCSITGLNQGAHLVLLPRFDAEETLAAVDRRKAHLALPGADDDEPHLAPAGGGARQVRRLVA